MQSIGKSFDTHSINYFHACLQKMKQATSKVIDFIQQNKIFMALGAYLGAMIAYTLGATIPLILLSGLAGSIVTPLFFNCLFGNPLSDFSPNHSKRVGKVWRVDELVEKSVMEEAVEEIKIFFKGLQINVEGYPTRSIYEIYHELIHDTLVKHDNRFDLDNLNGVRRALEQGLCFGQAAVQMKYISKNYDADNLHRTPFEQRKSVIYYQILQHVEAELLTVFSGVWQARALGASQTEQTRRKALLEQAKKAALIISMGLRSYHKDQKIVFTPPLKGQAEAKAYEQAFDLATKDFPQESVIAGWLQLKSNGSRIPGHVIWFQCSNNKFRFQDTIDNDQGLFEFSSKQELFVALKKQIGIHPAYRLGELEMVIFGIPKAS